jgi:hypothetical protein
LMSAWLEKPLPASSDDVALRLFALTGLRRESWKLEAGMPKSKKEVSTTIRHFIPSINEFARDTSSVQRQLFVERAWGGDIYRLKAQLYPETGEISLRLGVRTEQAFDFAPHLFSAHVDRDITNVSYVELKDKDALLVPDDTESRLCLGAYKAMELFIDEGPEVFLEEYSPVKEHSFSSVDEDEGGDWSPYNPIDERLREGELDEGSAQFTRVLSHDVELYVEHGERTAVLRICSDGSERARKYDWVMNLHPSIPAARAEERIKEFCAAYETLADGAFGFSDREVIDRRRRAAETICRLAVLNPPEYGWSFKESFLDDMFGKKLSRSLQMIRGVVPEQCIPEGPEQLLMQIDGELRCKVMLGNDVYQSDRPELFHELLFSVNPGGMSIAARNRLSGECSVQTSMRPSDKTVLNIVRAFSLQRADPKGDILLQVLLGSVAEEGGRLSGAIPNQGVNSRLLSNLPSPQDLDGRKVYECAARIVKQYERISGGGGGDSRVVWHPHEKEAEILLGEELKGSYVISLFVRKDKVHRLVLWPGMLSPEQQRVAAGQQRDFRVALPVTVPSGSLDRLGQTLVHIADYLRRDAAGERPIPSPHEWLGRKMK